MAEFETRVCLPQDRRAALELLYRHLPEPERDIQIEQLLNYNSKLIEGLILCEQQGRIVGVMLSVTSAGRTLMVWPPAMAADASTATQIRIFEHLVQRMKEYAHERNIRLVQVLASEEEQVLQPLFVRTGFFYLTRLLYLRRLLNAAPIPPLSGDVEFVAYTDSQRPQLFEVLEQSYQDSLDCPEINGVRSLDDIFESHRAQGEFRPDHWLLARRDGAWMGCLLLSGLPDLNALEVAYISVLPKFRGQGFGRQLTRKALHLAAQARVHQVTLAVDERNTPARKLYRSEHFEPWETRHAYLMVLDPANGKWPPA